MNGELAPLGHFIKIVSKPYLTFDVGVFATWTLDVGVVVYALLLRVFMPFKVLTSTFFTFSF